MSASLALVLGCLLVFLTRVVLRAWGAADPSALAVYAIRRYGVLFFGYALILWSMRNLGPSRARTGLLGGVAVVGAFMAALSLLGIRQGVVGPGMWPAVVVESLLAASALHFSWIGRPIGS
ncbi:MAG TPA: hypothetical protein VF459_11345 [Caulobacteraceae bacterium]